MWKGTDFLRRIVTSHNDAGSVTLSHGCPHSSVVPIGDFMRRTSRDWWCVSTTTGRKRHSLPTMHASFRLEATWVFKAHATSRRLRQVDIAANLAGEGELHPGGLRQFIDVDNHKTLVSVKRWWAQNSTWWTWRG